MAHRSDSIRTRHLAGVVHGIVQPNRVVVDAAQLAAHTPPRRAELVTDAEAAARGLLTRTQAAELLGLTPGQFATRVTCGQVEAAAYVRAGARGGARSARYDPADLTSGC